MKRVVVVALFLAGCGGNGGTAVPSAGGASGLGGAPGTAGGTGGTGLGDGTTATGGTAVPGAGGAGGSPGACMMAGAYCPDPGGCCPDSTCVQFSGDAQTCALNCTTAGQCASGCCAALSGSLSVCAPPASCSGGMTTQPETGTVVAADNVNGHYLIQTPSAARLFSSLGCNVVAGTIVTFSQPTASCLSNTLTHAGGSCSVQCEGSGYPGVVTSTYGDEYWIATQFGSVTYRGEAGACPQVYQGDQVLFAANPGACALTYFIDSRAETFCQVFCNM